MKTLFLLVSLIPIIFGLESCKISYTLSNDITNFEGCQIFSTSSSDKKCCYVKGKDKNGNDISACNELTGTERGAYKDLLELEGYFSQYKNYYLEADCNLGKKIALCDPDDRKSYSPLSVDECQKHSVVRLTGVDDESQCCYVSGVSVDNKNVYSCVGISQYFYTESDLKKEIESGNYKRLGALTNIKIECPGSNSNSNSQFYLYKAGLSLIIILFYLI